MPPPGGFQQIQYKRNLSLRGPSGPIILAAALAISAFGFWRVGQGNIERRCAPGFLSLTDFLLLLPGRTRSARRSA
jgi:hypothetical protein